jgi:hypothetical protein
MTSRAFVIRLMKGHFNSEVVCTGPQMQQILEAVKTEIADCIWFVADIDAFQVLPMGIERHNSIPALIGPTEELIEFAGNVDQFLSGIFLAVPEAMLSINWTNDYDTEAPAFKDMVEVVLEIRAFDTSFFLLYSRNLVLLERLSAAYSVAIERF